ncbi:MAG: porin [Balneolales bacterium]
MILIKVLLTISITTVFSSLVFAQNEVNSNDENYQQDNKSFNNAERLNTSGLLQSRYEYTFLKDYENLSSFYLRRIRLDFSGQLFGEQISYRIRPEFARTVGLEDAWINYAYNAQAQFRFGLVPVPFHWYRFISSSRHHFVERGVPSETFGFPSGRDFGLMFHGRNEKNSLSYQAGIFDGAGPDFTQSNSSGNVISGRLVAAVNGEVPEDETALEHFAEPNLSFGLGIQAANKNESRDWAIGRTALSNNRADWITGTSDISLRWMGLSVTADGFLRKVNPEAIDVDDYHGWAYMTSAGYFIKPQRLELVARYSDLRLDAEDPDTNESEMGIGLNIYHRDHDLKTRIQYLSQYDQGDIDFGQDAYFLVEVQLKF